MTETNNQLDEVTVILQGYSTSKDQLSEIYKYYGELGFNNVVVSSYKDSIPDELTGKANVFSNDDILGKYDRTKHNNGRGMGYQIKTTQRGIEIALELFEKTRYIVKLRADQIFYKLDVFVKEWLCRFQEINNEEGAPFEKKIVSMGQYIRNSRPGWQIQESSLSFGTTNDILKLWTIPTTQRDTCRSEDYVSTFYLIKHFSRKSSEEIERIISNDTILSFKMNPKDFFLFDHRTGGSIYSYKHKKYMKDYCDTSTKVNPELNDFK